MIADGRLPASLTDFRQQYQVVYDIETVERPPENLDASSPDAILNPISIGCASNIPGTEDQWFCVDSSDNGQIQIMVDRFMEYLMTLQSAYQAQIPQEIRDLIQKTRIQLADKKLPYNNKRRQLEKDLNCLKRFEILPVYGFNSARFDLVVLIPYIGKWCGKEIKTNMIKRGAQYMMLTVNQIQFRDVLDFTAPTNLSKYLKTWGASEAKSIFPYSFFKTIEEIEACTEFPPKEAFFNELKQVEIEQSDYDEAKSLYEEFKSLPESHPNHIQNFKGWLKYYNMIDCKPLSEAITNSFDKFYTCFKIDANLHLSLPSMAFKAMFNLSDKDSPCVVSFNEGNDDIRQLFRSAVIGGICNVQRRDLNLTDDESPRNSKIAPNGLRFKAGASFDFNGMYNGCQAEVQPTTPGIRWTKKRNRYRKSIMASGTSLAAQKWLYYMQESDLAKDDMGNKIQIQHKYFRGEHQVKRSYGSDTWAVDGYFEKNGVSYFLEFHGELKS